MDRQISGSVGQGGMNRAADVKTIQEMLNEVPPSWGGPTPDLDEDGLCGPKTIAAIRRFQEVQLSTYFTPDGRVDLNQRTLKRLNHIWDTSEAPGATLNISAEPIDHIRQRTNMVCWAAAGTMLVSARDKICQPVEAVMRVADRNDPGYGYLNMYENNQGLPPADTGRYTRAIGLRVGPAACFPVAGWRNLMQQNGAIGVVGLTPFLHIRVITEMKGDSSIFGTFFTVHDPGRSTPYQESFMSFTERYEAAATVDSRMDQIWHK